MEFIENGGLTFGRWIRQAPYLPDCGAIAATPHGALIADLPLRDQYAALELFRGTMVRHAFVCYRSDAPQNRAIDFASGEAAGYVPIRLPETLEVRDRLPPGAAAVLINRNHTYNDLYLPIDAAEERLLAEIDGKHTIAQIYGDKQDPQQAMEFFCTLWRWDQVVFDTHVKSERP
ncbi:MAG TPA: hypothetical protein VHT92_05500 [Candidatus Cybelea sp.]|jgi:hypothetical protein|nr:hypothetical protein [Candidatus Cybelea sp.]